MTVNVIYIYLKTNTWQYNYIFDHNSNHKISIRSINFTNLNRFERIEIKYQGNKIESFWKKFNGNIICVATTSAIFSCCSSLPRLRNLAIYANPPRCRGSKESHDCESSRWLRVRYDPHWPRNMRRSSFCGLEEWEHEQPWITTSPVMSQK